MHQKLIFGRINNISYKCYLTVKVVPEISTINFVSPLVAGPETKDPSEPNTDP
jgi:hypothetical protein